MTNGERQINRSNKLYNLDDSEKTRSFLKWAGGKYKIIDKIRQRLPMGNRLIEPFIGAGSVFLNTKYKSYLLSDINKDLISCFHYLQNDKQSFVTYCRSFFQGQYNEKLIYHELRTEFNTTHDARLKAALFVYLNRHCFNGLMRYNKDGFFNTPFGNYSRPYFPGNEMLAFVNKAQTADIICEDYLQVMKKAVVGDIVYCDPPYVPLSVTASFTKYNSKGFGLADQENLVLMARELAKKGIPVIISNHDTVFVQNLYLGANILCFDVQRSISCQVKNRGNAPELLALFD